MLSAIILAFDTPLVAPERAGAVRRDAIVRTLASLVEACVAGLIADALVVGPPDAGLGAIADEAGCALIEAADARSGLASALPAARCADVFVLLAGHALERGFIDEVGDLRAFGDRRARVLRAAPSSFLTRLAPRLAQPVGLIARKEDCRIAGDVAAMARRLRASDLSTRARRAV